MLIKFFAYYRNPEYAGCAKIEAGPFETVGQAMQFCCKKWPGFIGELVSEDGTQIGKDAIIMVNGRNVLHLEGLDTPLDNTDYISLFPRCAGG